MARILVVEDDGAVARVLVRAIEARGNDALWVRTTADALDAFERETWSAAMVDIGLLEDSFAGLELVREIRRRFPERHCSALTARMDPSLDNELYALGCAVLKKVDDVEAVVDRFLSRALPEDAARALQREFGLTPKETTVCRAIFDGRTIPAVALQLEMSVATVRTHVSSVLRKCAPLGADSLMQLHVKQLARRNS